MSLVLAAVGAAVAALIQSSILPFTSAGGAGLDLVLVLAVVWTMTVGLEGGLVWAFLGGLLIDVLLMRPLGLTAFVLLLAVGAAWLVGRVSPRSFYPIVVVTTAVRLPAAAGLVENVTVNDVAVAAVTVPTAPSLKTTVLLLAIVSNPNP